MPRPAKKNTASPDEAELKPVTFDAAVADRVVGALAHFQDRITDPAERALAPQFLRMIWLFGHTPPITSAEQYADYAEHVAEILRNNGAPMSDARAEEFLLSPDGAQATALCARMKEWADAVVARACHGAAKQ